MGKPKSRQPQVKAISTLADLTQDPANVRAHNPRNVGLIETALNEVGPARSIVVDEQGLVLAGNATVEAAARAGIKKVIPVDAEGDALIAVRRRGLTPEQKARLAILDNAPQMPQANPNYWDDEAAAQAVARDEEIFKGILYSGELAQLLGEDPVPQVPEEAWGGMPEFTSEDQSSWKQLIVHFETPEALQAFAELVGQPLTDKTKFIWYPAHERADLKSLVAHEET